MGSRYDCKINILGRLDECKKAIDKALVLDPEYKYMHEVMSKYIEEARYLLDFFLPILNLTKADFQGVYKDKSS